MQTANMEDASSGRLQEREVKNNQKIIKLSGPKSGCGRGRLQEVVIY